MNPSEEILMIRAIEQAEQCRPIADRIPKVGAVIAVGDTVIGMGHRGTGQPGDDDHAEMVALRGVADRAELAKATVYTTLEPCTPEVRSDPLTCCTELIRQAEVKKVFIGILDPNQGVRGKGLWELQERGIEVELFPPHLARRIRILNDKFIREQRKLGIRITNLESGQTIRTDDKEGVFELEGTFLNEPGKDVFAFLGKDTRWWPQPYSLSVSEGNNEAALRELRRTDKSAHGDAVQIAPTSNFTLRESLPEQRHDRLIACHALFPVLLDQTPAGRGQLG